MSQFHDLLDETRSILEQCDDKDKETELWNTLDSYLSEVEKEDEEG